MTQNVPSKNSHSAVLILSHADGSPKAYIKALLVKSRKVEFVCNKLSHSSKGIGRAVLTPSTSKIKIYRKKLVGSG